LTQVNEGCVAGINLVHRRNPPKGLCARFETTLRGLPRRRWTTTRSLSEHALAACVEPLKQLNQFLVPGLDSAGRRFEGNEYFVSQLPQHEDRARTQ
jgi:hypothetical protein